LHGFLDKIGDLSWAGPAYADKGWVELSLSKQEKVISVEVMSRLAVKKVEAEKIIGSNDITVEQKAAWVNYLLSLELVPLQADFPFAPKIPAPPVI
jgi:hypothetical protein